ncbi:hydrolase, peptidase M42 family [Chloroherpeton thalassium ATCC 35110]|uniref:Hydrolase, peptidase M42 family n=1 Tax=Chloroherpeton thalassium (strain ATCC 35110 / GB-78) TaxID=517418 RepID=B3QY68_CHLT3|nr:osmoprotectant NAGGN system M42 family peptidase [Chloroherpeton thalassium]ACF15034.1 hydrolase, peptidase M42 family [Chloroherpeton thalassium ATCC 35110]
MKEIRIDREYILDMLFKLLNIPSPSGYTDQIVHFVGHELERLQVPFELTRIGAMRGTIKGKVHSPDRAVVAHLDTLGAMVRAIKDNTRLGISPIGSWSPRFAEGARVTIFTDTRSYRGTILPLKASGHAYGDEIDTQPVSWENLEIRIDAICDSKQEVCNLGINVGDFVAIDPMPEWSPSGYINSRHLDNKAGVAALLAAIKAIGETGVELPVDCHPLFTIHEEIGYGASSILFKDISSMVVIDNSIIAPGQNSSERGVTIGMKDSVGPFDYHLTRKLIKICKEHDIVHHRDTFKYYRCDAASAVEAGNDIRTALVCFELDASHGYERTHIESIEAVAKLITLYMQSPVGIHRDAQPLGSLEGFPRQVEKPFRKEGNLVQMPEEET